MTSRGHPAAVIADDEAPLCAFLRRHLSECWPELEVLAEAHHGEEALKQIETLNPDVAFLDIQMPVMNGLEVARRVAGRCHVVFVTAYDEYAIEAFDGAAVDYILKPVSRDRLERTVTRLRSRLASPPLDLSVLISTLTQKLKPAASYLQWLQVSRKDEIVMLPVDDVDYFLASDKYTVVVTADKEWIIRTPLKDLEAELDPERFWRIHRNAIVRVASIASVKRDLRGGHALVLRRHAKNLAVGRNYAHRFRQM
jgi:DNA-binding LytR/AlgR family response regulator